MRTQRMTVPLQSIGCGSTGRALVERSLLELPGVLQAVVNPVTEMAYVEFDPAQCREEEVKEAVDRTGYGETRTRGLLVPELTQPNGSRLSATRFALAGGLWLALGFTICSAAVLLFPAVDRRYQLWALVLPGIGELGWSTYLLGVVEALVLGAISAWVFVWIYDAIPQTIPRLSRGSPRGKPATTARGDGRAS